ncbi:hypothetical protein DYB30_005407 [Aphanomyces astaci]|uniref:Phenazine biosynthesis protein PhzF family n=1 Tax=Aphanomyces astaci TaxID=112090 RepID=A0A397D551_APHAT|nr:hypothetical protein AaE_013659 [Aphanomyces astaci]RHY58902.1 hypothetical protein DYB38_004842 [Aphanomyces astaci]RHY78712.1 hypothetical protein DYB30_005407 [Aphanomyces astaci]RHZ08508.1 hypothetical protein DYB26_004800 [Aphanomyces astaci]RHZ32949.1 hypothetical protein DYB31_005685 [Aphanomyces astaci]
MTTTFHVNLFDSLLETRGAPGGSKAGVVHVTDGFPPDDVMQAVAKEVGYSETAFVWRQYLHDDNCIHVRFFTPEGEVDLCGHATIAAFSNMSPNTTYLMHTTKSTLCVSTDAASRVTMDQDLPVFHAPSVDSTASILASLGLHADDIDTQHHPMMVVSTGLPDLFVRVRTRTILMDKLRPNMESIAAVSKTLGTIGYHVYTLDVDPIGTRLNEADRRSHRDSLDRITAECRNFAPLYGIDEEAATGTSSGALGALLCHMNIPHYEEAHGDMGRHRMVFSQGRGMGLPSRIEAIVTVDGDTSRISRVSIAGIAESCGMQMVSVLRP